MKTVVIDCRDLTSVAEFWQRYIDVAQPADWGFFGRNLNAFWDAVEGGGPGWPGEVKLVFANSVELATMPDGQWLLDQLRKIAAEVQYTPIELA